MSNAGRLRPLRIAGFLVASSVLGAAALTHTARPAAAQAGSRALLDSLESARRQRMALEALLERELATGIAERARTLAMSDEANGLERLELLLDSAQARLLVQRDRIRLLRDAATLGEKAILVVLFRAEAVPDGDVSATLRIGSATMGRIALTPAQKRGLMAGGAEELYRSEIVPTQHSIVVSVAAPGGTVEGTVTIGASSREVRYVEFVWSSGRLVSTTWTSRSAP